MQVFQDHTTVQVIVAGLQWSVLTLTGDTNAEDEGHISSSLEPLMTQSHSQTLLSTALPVQHVETICAVVGLGLGGRPLLTRSPRKYS